MNNVYGITEDNPLAWYQREVGVFDRMDALDLEFMGPQHPDVVWLSRGNPRALLPVCTGSGSIPARV